MIVVVLTPFAPAHKQALPLDDIAVVSAQGTKGCRKKENGVLKGRLLPPLSQHFSRSANMHRGSLPLVQSRVFLHLLMGS